MRVDVLRRNIAHTQDSTSLLLCRSQKYDSIVAKCTRKGALWEDDQFPADDSSVYAGGEAPFKLQWLRPQVTALVDGADAHRCGVVRCSEIQLFLLDGAIDIMHP